MANLIKINLDTVRNSYETLELMQGYTYNFEFDVTQGGKNIDLEGVIPRLDLARGNGTYVIQTEDIEKEGNFVKGKVNKTFTNSGGRGEIQLILTKEDEIFGSWVISCNIKRRAVEGLTEEENVITILSELDNKIDKAVEVKNETEKLIENGGAATAEQVAEVSSQLANIEIRVNSKEDNTVLLSKFYEKLNNKGKVTICTRGDSVTYGQTGNISANDNRPALVGHTAVRASTSYPETLESVLKTVYGTSLIEVINRGYSGDTVTLSHKRWTKTCNSDITLIMLGINDRNKGMDTFIEGYRKIIKKELSWGSAVVLLTPTKTGTGSDSNQQSYRNAVYMLAKEFNCPVIDTLNMLKNYSVKEIMPDWTHFTGEGYEILGKRITGHIINNSLITPKKILSDDYLLCRKNIDSLITYGSGKVTITESSREDLTPPEGNFSRFAIIPAFGRITYSFNSQCDNLIAIPIMEVEGYANVVLDFNAKQAYNSIANRFQGKISPSSVNFSKKTYVDTNAVNKNNFKKYGLAMPTNGQHTITIENDNAGNIVFYGLYFVSMEDLIDKSEITRIGGIPTSGRYYANEIYFFDALIAGGYIGCTVLGGGEFSTPVTGGIAKITQQFASGIFIDKKDNIEKGDLITIEGNSRTFKVESISVNTSQTGYNYLLQVTPNTGGEGIVSGAMVRLATPNIKKFGVIDS